MVDLLQIIQNIVAAIPSLSGLLYTISFIIGIIFGISGLKSAAKRHELGKSVGSWSQPAWLFLTGVLFIALPGLVQSLTLTFFAEEQPAAEAIFAYAPSTIGIMDADSPGRDMIIGIVTIIQFIGLIAVMRGIYLLNQSAQSAGGGPKTFGPGLTFVISGIMAVNFPLFVGMIELLITTGS